MASTRKRRAASLNAEALWNIQLEDDVIGTYEQKEPNSKITLREIVKLQNKKSRVETLVNANHSIKESYVKKPERIVKPTSCVHQSTVNESGKVSQPFGARKKPTASVVPLVKSESSLSYSLAGNSHGTDSVTGSSQVLLLPISLNTDVRRIDVSNASVPIFTLHPTAVKVDLMRCLDNSRILNVAPMISGNSGLRISHSKNDYRTVQNSRYHQNTYRHNHQHSTEKNQSSFDQTEPLNLKLGESSIPSRTINAEERLYIMNRNTRKSSTWLKHNQSSCNVEKQAHNKSSYGEFSIRYKFPININSGHGSDSKAWTGYDAYSPSSESSCSTEPDDISTIKTKKKSSQKVHINLRCKAAPPLNDSARVQVIQYTDAKTQKRKRRAHEVADNNGWQLSGNPYDAFVYSVETGRPVLRRCYPSMRRKNESSENSKSSGYDEDDVVMVRDCVIMRADAGEQPYVAKVAALWSQPNTNKMMISLLWFYRPEHTQDSRVLSEKYNDDELFASRHLDEISVACVEDKCYVLTYNKYCRFSASSEKEFVNTGAIDGRDDLPTKDYFSIKKHFDIIPDIDKSLVYFCRKLYDIKSHRLLKSYPPPTPLFMPNSRSESVGS